MPASAASANGRRQATATKILFMTTPFQLVNDGLTPCRSVRCDPRHTPERKRGGGSVKLYGLGPGRNIGLKPLKRRARKSALPIAVYRRPDRLGRAAFGLRRP